MYSSGEVDRIGILRIAFLDDYVRGNQLGKVVHGKFREYFLVDVLHLFCVEMDKAKSIFELAEGSFNSPASGIQIYTIPSCGKSFYAIRRMRTFKLTRSRNSFIYRMVPFNFQLLFADAEILQREYEADLDSIPLAELPITPGHGQILS